MKTMVRLWTKRTVKVALFSALFLPSLILALPSAVRAEPKLPEPKVQEPKVPEQKAAEHKALEEKVPEHKVAAPKVAEPKLPKPKVSEAEVLPARVTAVYRIKFGLLGDIGWFSFTSKLDGDDYKLTAKAKIDTSVFDYVGQMASGGALISYVTKPADYKFSFRQKALFGKKKQRSLAMEFDNSGVTSFKFTPPDPPSAKAIPITEEHLIGALDPLSGVMALSLGDLTDPCDQKLPIFDGKQRFDLVFTRARSGAPNAPQVCHVRLNPIAGHKKGEGADSVIKGNIEVVLAPIAKANIIVPKKVTVPTIIGAAELTTERIEIVMPDKKRFALRN